MKIYKMLDECGSYNELLDKVLIVLISLCIVMYPMTALIVGGMRSVYLVVLYLLTIIVFSFRWSKIKAVNISRMEKRFLVSYLLMFAVALLSILIMGEGVDGEKRLAAYSGFLLSIPLYYLFKLYMPSSRIIWGAITVACYIIVTRAYLEVNGFVEDIEWSSFPVSRANGAMHPIRFGNLSLLLGFISLAGSFYIKDIKLWMKVSGVVAFLGGLSASVMSQSRGGWIAIPVLLIIVIWPMYRKLQFKSKAILLLSILVGTVVIFNVPGLKIGDRFEQAVYDVNQYQEHDNSGTSVGARFDMYETAYSIFQQNPFFGVGIGHYRENSAAYYEIHKDRISSEVITWGNPHNEVLLHMATRGIIGLLVVMLFFAVGVWLFFKAVRKYNDNTLFYAVSGLMVYVAYLHYGMSIALFMHRDLTVFFLMYVTLFVAGIYRQKSKSDEISIAQ